MGRLMAIDYGLKRTGLAETDDLQIIATPLATVETPALMDYLATYLSKHRVDIIVVGDPRGLDGRPTDATAGADGFANALQNRFPNIRVERYNEMFTSKMASRAIAQSGLPKHKRQEKGLTDRVSAVLILQGFMERMG